MMFQGPKGYIAKLCEVHLQYGNSTIKWHKIELNKYDICFFMRSLKFWIELTFDKQTQLYCKSSVLTPFQGSPICRWPTSMLNSSSRLIAVSNWSNITKYLYLTKRTSWPSLIFIPMMFCNWILCFDPTE